MEKIEVGEYVRTMRGNIGKFKDYGKDDYDIVYFKNGWGLTCVDRNEIVKHSKNIIDLIEVGDVLELREYIDIFKQTEKLGVSDIEMLNTIKEGIEKNKVKLISILTHEQYENNCYKVKE